MHLFVTASEVNINIDSFLFCLSSEYFWLKVNRVHLLDKLRHLSWGWGQPAASARCIPTSPHRSSVRAAAGRGWRGRCWRWGPGQSELVIVVTWPSFLQSQLTWPWRWSSRHSAQNLSTLEMIWIMFQYQPSTWLDRDADGEDAVIMASKHSNLQHYN